MTLSELSEWGVTPTKTL